MGDNPLRLAVVIPSLNRARFIEATIDSVLSQDYPDIECVVVDGGSRDGTLELLEGYGDRIRWISEPDRGPFDAINKGWAMTATDVVAWLNADDTYEAGAVSRAMRHLAERPDVDVLHGLCATINLRGEVDRVWGSDPWDYIQNVMNCACTIEQPAAFIRRRAIERVGGLRDIAVLDFDLWIRLSAAKATFLAVDEQFASAVDHPGRITNRPEVMIPAVIEVIRKAVTDPAAPKALRQNARRALSSAHAHGFYFVGHRRWSWVARCAIGALAADPTNARGVFRSLGNALEVQPGSPAPVRAAAALSRKRPRVSDRAIQLLQLGALVLLWHSGRRRLKGHDNCPACSTFTER